MCAEPFLFDDPPLMRFLLCGCVKHRNVCGSTANLAQAKENIITTSFESLGLAPELLRAVSDQGYTEPTPVQVQSIPVILDGCDVMAGAQTGTGKTAGFTLPLLQRLVGSHPQGGRRDKRRPVRALILTPTRELAVQVHESVNTYARHVPVKATVIYGGVSINPQISALRRGVDIVVATPGRLLDHAGQRTIDLSQVETLILDEADRMLDMGFLPDIKRIINLLPKQRQNLLFSATFPNEIRGLAAKLLNDPIEIQVAASGSTADGISQVVYPVQRSKKRELLAYLISFENWKQVLVFTRTKHGANRLAQQLVKDGLSATAIHGNKSQAARTKALAEFKAEKVRVLVATDIAARGLDIDQLPHVVNFELPHVPEDYVHRIGRTGRAGNEGQAASLVSGEEANLLRGIERLLKKKLDRRQVTDFEMPNLEAPAPGSSKRGNQRRDGQGQRPYKSGSGGYQGRRDGKSGNKSHGRKSGAQNQSRSNPAHAGRRGSSHNR